MLYTIWGGNFLVLFPFLDAQFNLEDRFVEGENCHSKSVPHARFPAMGKAFFEKEWLEVFDFTAKKSEERRGTAHAVSTGNVKGRLGRTWSFRTSCG